MHALTLTSMLISMRLIILKRLVRILLISQHLSDSSQTPKSNPFLMIKSIALVSSIILFAGCSSLGGGSVEKRAAKLSAGIQRTYKVQSSTADRVSPMIVKSADQYAVDPLLIAAVIRQESSYRNYAVSSAGAVGLTQIMPRYWQQSCPGDLFDETINVNCGAYILAKYNQSAGSWKKALAYYNVGPTNYNTNRKMKKQGKKYAKQVKQHEKDLKSSL